MDLDILKFVVDQGFLMGALIFIAYLFYRFMIVKIKAVEKDLMRKIEDKKYHIKGRVHINDKTNDILINVMIQENQPISAI
jgi:hypothetical protein